jgi:hypothetical protein
VDGRSDYPEYWISIPSDGSGKPTREKVSGSYLFRHNEANQKRIDTLKDLEKSKSALEQRVIKLSQSLLGLPEDKPTIKL